MHLRQTHLCEKSASRKAGPRGEGHEHCAGRGGEMKKRVIAIAAGVWLFVAVFGLSYRAFERAILAPNLGVELAAFLATTTLAGAVLVIVLLLIGTRSRAYTRRELWTISV